MRFVLVAVPLVAFVACSHAQPAPVAAPAPPPAPSVQVIAEPPPAPVAAPVAPPLTNVSVYFDYDSSELSPEVRAVLEAFFDQAQKHPDQRIRIEGNCDERGSREYNVALGQRRADAAKKYLTNLGLPADRITTISYGKERPRAAGHDEEAWKENRRDDLVPQGAEKSDAVSQR
ncbi:MAG TPA: peptidoglycan-associated lipoprotein Pal [Myxococcales bacterium]|nr:peptidoglycan-associated lipoprotein Pal [Myxococcales bacterium]